MLGILMVACSFGAYDSEIPFGKLNSPADATLAVSVDGSTLWAQDWYAPDGSYQPRLKVFDRGTNNTLGSAWWGNDWAPRAIAPAHAAGHEDVAWVLHANGYRIRWDTDLAGYSEIEAPIPTTGATAADGRFYCDMDQGSDGVQYVTAIDLTGGGWDAYLYREPSEGVWERVGLPTLNGKCGRVSWDGPADEVSVLDTETDQMLRFDADDLLSKGAVDLSAVSGTMIDFAAIGAHAIVANKIPGPTADSLEIVDPSGTILDSVSLASVRATFVHILGEEARVFWTGADSSPIKYTAGSWTLED